MRLALSLLALLVLTACTTHVRLPRPARAPSADPYVEALVQRADALRLHDQKQWLRLGHYRRGAFDGSLQSEADHHTFFVAEHGREDPRAELHATLRAFFEPPVEEPKSRQGGNPRHALCRFPARFMWLAEQLQIEFARLPRQQCGPYVQFLQEIDPKAVSVMFSSYYLNNPASAFGHTFLRFTKARTLAVGEKRELLDYAVDFAADVDTNNALVYAFRGLTGAFPGTAKRMPYYYKVRTYADFESRDMWEYELSFTPQQLLMLVAHIWEIGPTFFQYFYLSENCSYRINRLLEAANPDIELIDSLQTPVLPADTVKVLFDNPGLVKNVSYRPSLRTQFLRAARDLDGAEADVVGELARDPEAAIPTSWSPARRAEVLDAALDLHDMRYVEKIAFERESKEAKHKQRLLERRAAILIPSRPLAIEAPVDRRPDIGHDAKRVGVAPGYRAWRGAADEPFVAFDFRLAMHDMADPSLGFPDLASIEFLPTRLRLYPKEDGLRIRLDDFSIMQVVSLNPMHRFDHGLSWRLSAGAKTLERNGCHECFAGKLRVGAGATLSFLEDGLGVFLLAETAIYGGDLSGILKGPVRAGIGPYGGIRWRVHPRLIFVGTGELHWYPEQHDRIVWQGDGTLRWGFAEQHALSLEGRLAARLFEGQLFYLAYL